MKHADENLLLGILALQNYFINRDQLVAALQIWITQKSKSLGEILCEQRLLNSDTHQLLLALVNRHLEMHDQDAHQSLAALSSIGSTRDELAKIPDQDLAASLAKVSVQASADDANATKSYHLKIPDGAKRYRILRPHAKGGLGKVSVARDAEVGREVALKEIQDPFADDQGSRRRFVFEAEITGCLEHPGIVPIYGLGHYANGRPYYAMRFVQGDSLKDAIAEFHESAGGSWSANQQLEMRKLLGRFMDVCNAVAYAHSRGVLHRDLKPGNIMLGKYGETLVVDWGLAKVQDDRSSHPLAENNDEDHRPLSGGEHEPTQMGALIGSPAYMPPEQAEGRLDEIGPASDVYSLGATLYCLLTGRPPHAGKSTESMLESVRKGDFRAPQELNAAIPKPLEAICLKAMRMQPSDRYASPSELAEEVEKWLADEPISARPDTTWDHLARWTRRHRGWTLSGAAALLLVTVISFVSFVLIRNALHEAQTAKKSADESAQAYKRKAEEATREKNLKDNALLAYEASNHLASQRDYNTQIALAKAALEKGDFAGAKSALEDCRWELRGWEHGHLYARSRAAIRLKLAGYSRVMLSPDGQRLAAIGRKHSLAIIDANDGELIREIRENNGSVDGDAMSWSGDGKTIAGVVKVKHKDYAKNFDVDRVRHIRVFDIDTGAARWQSRDREVSFVQLAFGPDGRLFSLDETGRVDVWDLTSGEEVRHFEVAKPEQAAFSRNGAWLVNAAKSDGEDQVEIWNVLEGRRVSVIDWESNIDRVAINSSGTRVTVSDSNGAFELQPEDGGQTRRKLTTNNQAALSMAGRHIAWSADRHAVKIGMTDDLSDMRKLYTARLVYSVDMSANAKRLATSTYDGDITILNLENEQDTVELKSARFIESRPVDLAGTTFAARAALDDRSTGVAVWDMRTGELFTTIDFFSPNETELSPNGETIAIVGSSPSQVGIFSARSGKELFSVPITLKEKVFPRVAAFQEIFSGIVFRDQRTLVVVAGDRTEVWKTTSRQNVRSFKVQHSGKPEFSDDGRRLVIGNGVYDFEKGALAFEAPLKPGLNAISADGSHLAILANRMLGVWNARGEKIFLREQDQSKGFIALAFSPTGNRVVGLNGSGFIRFWDVSTGEVVIDLVVPRTNAPLLAFTKTGSLCLLTSDRQLYQLAPPVSQPLTADYPANRDVQFSTDGARIVSTGMRKEYNFAAMGDMVEFVTSVIDARTGNLLLSTPTGDIHEIPSKFLQERITIEDGSTIRIWDVASGQKKLLIEQQRQLLPTLRENERDAPIIYATAYSRDGRRVAAYQDDESIKVSAVTGSDNPLIIRDAFNWRPIYFGLWGEQGTLLVCKSEKSEHSTETEYPVFDSTTGKLLVTTDAYEIRFGKDESRILGWRSAAQRGEWHVWNAKNGKHEFMFKETGSFNNLNGIVFSHDESRCFVPSRYTPVFDTETRERLCFIDGGPWDHLSFNPTGSQIVGRKLDLVGSEIFTQIAVFDATSGKQLLALTEGEDEISRVISSADAKWLLAGKTDGTLVYWDTSRCEKPREIQAQSGIVTAMAYAPNLHQALLGYSGGRATICDLERASIVSHVRAEVGAVRAIALSPQQDRFVLGGESRLAIFPFDDDVSARPTREIPGDQN